MSTKKWYFSPIAKALLTASRRVVYMTYAAPFLCGSSISKRGPDLLNRLLAPDGHGKGEFTKVRELLTHTLAPEQIQEAYRILLEEKDKALGIVLRWPVAAAG